MTRLTILHTNDIHGRVEQLARIATLAKKIRREVVTGGGYCALVDAGDVEDPTLFESSMTKGRAVMALLRAADYDLIALGNASPLRYGPQVVKDLAERLGQPLLAANMIDSVTNILVEGLEPYVIRTFGDLRVGIIGMTAPMSIYNVFQLRMVDPVALLPELIARVRACGAQMVVLLSHLGLKNDQTIAEQVSGLDLIIGGHSHTELNPPEVVNGTLVAQAGDKGRFLGRLDLEIDPAIGKIVSHQGELLPVGEEIQPDPIVVSAFNVEKASVRQMTLHVIGELSASADFSEERQCAAGNLFADVLLDRVKGAEIALAIAGHWRGGLDAGPLTLGALNAALRSSANPARVELTGAQVVEFLRNALKPENAARRPTPLRGVAVGQPHVAGLTACYDPQSFDIVNARVGDQPLRLERKYIVAGTDMEFYEVLGYLSIPQGQIEYEVPTIMPEVVEEYIAKYSPIRAPTMDRLVAAPLLDQR